jgi:hypothetical protein
VNETSSYYALPANENCIQTFPQLPDQDIAVVPKFEFKSTDGSLIEDSAAKDKTLSKEDLAAMGFGFAVDSSAGKENAGPKLGQEPKRLEGMQQQGYGAAFVCCWCRRGKYNVENDPLSSSFLAVIAWLVRNKKSAC